MKFEDVLVRKGYKNVLKDFKSMSTSIGSAPFDAKVLPESQNVILIDKKLKDSVDFIKETIDIQRKTGDLVELPFLMFGYEDKNGNVIINKIDFDFDAFEKKIEEDNKNPSKAAASFKGELTDDLNDYAKNSKYDKPVIIHGHTHPSTEKKYSNELSNCFSFDDMQGYRDLAEGINAFNKKTGKNVQVANMVVNSAGDFNVVFCDAKNDGMFYKIDKIGIENENGGVDRLQSYKGRSISDRYATK